MLRRSLVFLVASVLAGAGALSLLPGCGSAPPSEYEEEITRLLEEAVEAREETAHILAGEDPATEQERVEASLAALEEAVTALDGVIAALEDVKVPGGREDEHRALLESLAGERAFYERLISALDPGGELGGEGSGGAGEGGGEDQAHGVEEEDGAHGSEVPPVEEGEPDHGEAPAEGGH